MIHYHPRTSRARARLLANYNDIDVFVEDHATRNLYVRVLSRILGARRTLSSVICLDTRQNVIDACAADQVSRGRARIYIIDGDLDLLNGRPLRRLRHLYRLGVYCSENLVCTEHAAVCIAQEGRGDKTYTALTKELGIERMLTDAERKLLPLFLVYAVCNQMKLGLTTVDFSVQRLLEDPSDPRSLSSSRIRERMKALLREIRGTGRWAEYHRLKRSIVKRIQANPDDVRRYISGKRYLQPLVALQLRKSARVQDSGSAMSIRLANYCELDVDRNLGVYLKGRFRKACQ